MFKSFFLDKKYLPWSVLGSIFLLAASWYQVSVQVLINEWYGEFFDTIQDVLTKPNSVPLSDVMLEIFSYIKIAGIYIIFSVVVEFITRHYVFRWRTAMNDYYMSHWDKLRHIEGASQRIQEDTMRFAKIVESLGISFINSLMTLFAFLPLLWELSKKITTYPLIGEVSHGLIYVAILFSLGGTLLLALVGIKLPGLEFNNQKVEAAYRKELVYGEDDPNRADPVTVKNLYKDVRKNYFKLYWNYFYFDMAKWSYIQFDVMVPYIVLAPTIVAGVITLGVFKQITRAFNQVEGSFQFFVYSWGSVVELMSIRKRLKAFEENIH
ncbi:putative transporter [Pasteurella atlantica]|uniref:Transporter n=1 Tax=Pasteurella atlantica TaxID=2827233 RepID=A0AAW8CRI8_9PAST|nr:putative transporter [Pasteurella atlantica]MBR0573980.1 putative transporter [Pasteurella atlantica]MDP8033801.1 putative transporter [Pasteurella atlantica]MDP8035736.1 putative transporter [Pasteurella atlantica]MDP8037728.1 putative transporter [Pasteurella atlantica]MDP8039943.1 putative transporter [Pasteurella atlantica]